MGGPAIDEDDALEAAEDKLDDELRLEDALDAEICEEPEDDDEPMLDDKLDRGLRDELPEEGDPELLGEDPEEPLVCDETLD